MSGPVTIPGLEGVKQVSAGREHSLFLMNDGTVKATGRNNDGQLGLGHSEDVLTPQTIPGLFNVKEVSAGSSHSMFLMEDGIVMGAGKSSHGQLGTGFGSSNQVSPVNVSNVLNVKHVIAGVDATFYVLESAIVKASGVGNAGKLGTGNSSHQSYPIQTLIDGVMIVDRDSDVVLPLEATQAVETAEATKTQEDVDTARALVDALPDGEDKDSLNARLDAVQAIIDADNYQQLVDDATLAVEDLEASPSLEKVTIAHGKVSVLESGETKDNLFSRIITQMVAILEDATASATTVEEVEAIEFFFENNTELHDAAPPELMESLDDAKEALAGEPTEPTEPTEPVEPVSASVKEATRLVELAEALKREPHIQNAVEAVASLDDSEEKTALEERLFALQEEQSGLDIHTYRTIERFVQMAELTKREPHISRANDFVETMSPSEAKTAFIVRLESIAGTLNASELADIQATQAVEKAEAYGLSFLVRTATSLVEALENETLKTELLDRLSAIQ